MTAIASRSEKRDAGFRQRRADYGNDIAQMFARGEFRNDTPIRRMDCDLRSHDAREYATPALYYRRCSFITGAFDGENHAAVWAAA